MLHTAKLIVARIQIPMFFWRMAYGIVMLSIFVWGYQLVRECIPCGSTKMVYISSYMAGIESLVDYGKFSIEESQYKNTIDIATIDGKIFSSKLPISQLYGASIYWLYKQFTGGTIIEAYKIITYSFGLLPHMILLVCALFAVRRFLVNPIAQILAYTGMSAGYIGTLYARVLNNHTVAAMLLFIALYLGMRIRHSERQHWSMWVVTGVVAGLLPTIDVPSASFTVGLMIYLFFIDTRKTLLYFLPAMAIPLIVHFAVTYGYTSSVLPTQLRGLDANPGDATGDSPLVYFYHMMVGHHGIFAYSPLALLGIAEICRQIFLRAKLWRESLLLLSVFIVLVLYYTLSMKTNNYGGLAVSFRWFIQMMPPLVFFAGVFLDRLSVRWYFPIICLLCMLFISVNIRHIEREERPFRIPVWEVQYKEQGLFAYPCFVLGKCP